MTPLHCVFTLSLFWWPEPLKYINGLVFLWKWLRLQRTTLWAYGSFWRRSGWLLINWHAPVTGTISLSISAQGACYLPTRFCACMNAQSMLFSCLIIILGRSDFRHPSWCDPAPIPRESGRQFTHISFSSITIIIIFFFFFFILLILGH